MAIDPTLHDGYFGPNPAHQAFKQEIIRAKVLFYQLRESRDRLKAAFIEKIENTRRAAPGSFSIGMVVEVLSATQMRILNIPHNEAALVVANYEALEPQFYALLYVEIQRILESFLIDLFGDIARKDRRVLMSSKTITSEEALRAADIVELVLEKQRVALSHSDREGFEKQFVDLGLAIAGAPEMPPDERDFLRREFVLLWAVRNVLQHNHGTVNDLFLKKAPDSGYQNGDRITIDVAKLGRAFAAVEGIADDLNRRAVAKFGLV